MMAGCKIYIVEKFEERKMRNSEKKFIVGMVCEGEEEKESAGASSSSGKIRDGKRKVVPCYLNDMCSDSARKVTAIGAGKRVLLTNVVRSPSCLRITGMTKVITKVCDFPVDMEAVEAFIKPNVVSVAEAKGSPLKRRLSVCGDVVEIGDYVESPSCKRRSLKLEEDGTNVDVVLWGEAACESRLIESGDKVTITALVKDEDRLSSTLSSVIECSTSEGDEKKGVIIAIDDESGFPVEMILESGDSIYVPENVNFNFDIALPVEVSYVESSGLVANICVFDATF
ncbi:uncharacterized protein LOC117105197 [Anneissia japonica]|uniref:uncharacterized protein LOC117105197 n=1 Tax=Anneissia japonica TaxID=1529436 RepID=UPI0014259902|nr:uncharacterized protein LOC117105197 [Anneissia japonica]